ncbi:MAG: beta-ketoacyl-[acyl-carrier-protein] synthase family protein [Planctomycetales bacterium]
MSLRDEIVVTGMGVVSPIGIGVEAFGQSLWEGRCGVGPIQAFDSSTLPIHIAAEVTDFEPKEHVRPRKSLKIMARDAQFAVTAAGMALKQADFPEGHYHPERIGVLFGADIIRLPIVESAPSWKASIVADCMDIGVWGASGMFEGHPLAFLKHLPNSLACHASIIYDARGPNNTLQDGAVSSLCAIAEGVRVIERGQADSVIVGGASSRLHPLDWVRSCLGEELAVPLNGSIRQPRPFDALRGGMVRGEGGAAFVLERRDDAQARGATILARILGSGTAWAPGGDSIRLAIRRALTSGKRDAADVGFVSAHGLGTIELDQQEAQAVVDELGDVPVTAFKSYFGNLYSACGAMETAATLVSLQRGCVPPILNYEKPDPNCPIRAVVGEPLASSPSLALTLSATTHHQAAAMLFALPE